MPTWWRNEKGYVGEAGALCISWAASRSCRWAGGRLGRGAEGQAGTRGGGKEQKEPSQGWSLEARVPFSQVGCQAGREHLRSPQLGLELS